jgi:hypothetical protein
VPITSIDPQPRSYAQGALVTDVTRIYDEAWLLEVEAVACAYGGARA